MPNIALELGKQSATFGVKSAYGEQIDIDGVRIVPVALAWSGFGGGSDDAIEQLAPEIDTFMVWGEPLADAEDYGRELIPRVRALVAERARARATAH